MLRITGLETTVNEGWRNPPLLGESPLLWFRPPCRPLSPDRPPRFPRPPIPPNPNPEKVSAINSLPKNYTFYLIKVISLFVEFVKIRKTKINFQINKFSYLGKKVDMPERTRNIRKTPFYTKLKRN